MKKQNSINQPFLTHPINFNQQGKGFNKVNFSEFVYLSEKPEEPIKFSLTNSTFIFQKFQEDKPKLQIIPFSLDIRMNIIEPNKQQHGQIQSKKSFDRIKFQIKRNSLLLYQFFTNQKQKEEKIQTIFRKNLILEGLHEEYRGKNIRGQGHFAKVITVKRNKDNKLFAIKCFPKQKLIQREKNDLGFRSLLNEVQIMKNLNHKNIVKFHQIYSSDKSVYLAMENIQGYNLMHYIQNNDLPYPSIQIFQFMKGLLESLQYLAEKRIVHRDIKPENIVLKNNVLGSPILIDFGLAEFCDKDQYLTYGSGTPGYMAPQIFKCQKCHLEPVSDIFSAGLLFYILLTKKAFFSSVYEDILKKNSHYTNGMLKQILKQSSTIQSIELDLLIGMLEENPKKRLTAKSALEHAYFCQQETSLKIDKKQTKQSLTFREVNQ